MSDCLREIVARNRAGEPEAIPSVCTAHADVLEACLALAAEMGRTIVVEATSNQVNQFGGYTGMRATDFVQLAKQQASAAGLPPDALILGGDHLGPQAWRDQPAAQAMAHAQVLVSDYVSAGFTKIHLDCAEPCLDDADRPDDTLAAHRAAVLAQSCMQAAKAEAGDLCFVIGTEVPPPGGALSDAEDNIPPTPAQNLEATLTAHKTAFSATGVGDAFDNVVGLVVQPGVEFSPTHVHHYPNDRTLGYLDVLNSGWDGICLEAHSTDYQKPRVFKSLAKEGFAFQKVGPALTFAWRQAVYALDLLRAHVTDSAPQLARVMEQQMLMDTRYWAKHYGGSDIEMRDARHFGLADRIRYYWPTEQATAAVTDLFDWVAQHRLSHASLEQVFDPDVLDRAQGLQGSFAKRLCAAQVQTALLPYFFDASTCNGALMTERPL